MNGFGLLIAVAALGVDVGWETGPGGQSYYTIHIEEVLLQRLRDGEAIVSKIDVLDRNLTRFQIIVGDHSHAINRQPGPNGSDVVQHGWRPGEKGGTDYLIQISPARFESLAKGSIIIGQIDPQVTDIRALYVFSGVQPLPQTLGPANGFSAPPKFFGAEGGLRTASAESTERSDLTTRMDTSQPGGRQPSGTQFGGLPSNRGPATGAARAGNFPVGGGSTSTDGFPPLVSSQPQPGDLRTGGQPNLAWQNGAPAPIVGEARYGLGDQSRASQQADFGRASQSMSPVQSGYGRPNTVYDQTSSAYGGAAAAYPPNFEKIIADAKALGAAEAKIAAAEKTPAPTAVSTPASETEVAKESGFPLILTTLMLITSLGINLFLGWMAWSYFWRYRDAVGDATRAQSTLFSTRQAA